MRDLVVEPYTVSFMSGAVGLDSPILYVVKVIQAKADAHFLILANLEYNVQPKTVTLGEAS